MRKLSNIFCILALLGALYCTPAPLRGQTQQVSLTTVSAILAQSLTCTGTPQNFITTQGIPNFRNQGQTSHLATATSNAPQFQMEIDGIDSLGNVFRLSDLQLGVPSTAKGGLVVTAAGYMTNIQVSVTCSSGSIFSVSYSGSFSPQPPSIAGALLAAVEKLPFQVAAANATSSTTFQTPGGNSQGTIVFQFSGTGPAGSQISAQCITNSGTNLASFNFMLTTAATPQLFTVTQATCPFVTLTYTSGGASAVTYNLEYVFNAQATQQTLASSSSGFSTTSPLQVVSDSLGQAYQGGAQFSGPALNSSILGVHANNGARNLYFDHAIVDTATAGTFNFSFTNTAGTGCGTASGSSLNFKTPFISSTANLYTSCTAAPGNAGPNILFDLPANSGPVTIDLRGIIMPAGTLFGIDLQAASAGLTTGRATIFWYER